MSSDTGKYGTFAEKEGKDDEALKEEVEYEWEKVANPWALFLNAMIVIGKNAAALLLLYCTLLRGSASKKNLLVCTPLKLAPWQVYACEYTKSFLRAFPLLAMCVTLCIATRVIVQMRAYYGFLKVGGLLDFKNVEGLRDPLLVALLVSVIHSIAHFALKLTDGHGSVMEEGMQVLKNFIVPYLVFLAFLYDSNDLEKLLVPLSKYIEEDPEQAKRVLGSIAHLEEHVVRSDVVSRDVVGDAIARRGGSACIEAVYREVIDSYAGAKARVTQEEQSNKTLQFHMKDSLWPAGLLIDSRLTDEKSASFRTMFRTFLVICTIVQFMVFALFFHQAVIKDLYFDVYVQGEEQDALSACVLLAHAIFVAWIMQVTLLPIMASSVQQDAENLKQQVGHARSG